MNTEIIKEIKRQFYTFRNGMLADRLRSAGDPHKFIFGLNLPQIVEIANTLNHNAIIAQELWNNRTTRESQLLAPMIFPIDEYSETFAESWIASITTTEVADILCHKLLRYTPFAQNICDRYLESADDMKRYTALRLAFNLLIQNKYTNIHQLKELTSTEILRKNSKTNSVAHSLYDEIEFRLNPSV